MHAHRCDVCSKLQFAKNIFAIRSMPPQVTIFPTYRPLTVPPLDEIYGQRLF